MSRRVRLTSTADQRFLLVHLKWVASRFSKIAASAPSDVALVLSVHITGESPQVEELRGSSEADVEKDASVDEEDTKSKAELDALVEGLDVTNGRPDVFKILEAEVNAAVGPVSVDGELYDRTHAKRTTADRKLCSCGSSFSAIGHAESVDWEVRWPRWRYEGHTHRPAEHRGVLHVMYC